MKALAWVVVTLCLWPWGGAPRSTVPLSERLLGPAAGLLASAAWVRFDALVRDGRYEAAYDVAERALDLDPSSPQGWLHYAAHLGRFRASAENEADPGVRRRWVRAALEVLARGETRCDKPGDLALSSGLILLLIARLEEEGDGLDWPGGAEGARRAAEQALGRAQFHGVRVLEAADAMSGHSH
jgi:tetratricopeptide (TPR) repeat protein